LYSSWWYWPIVKRAMIDWYVIPCIFLGALISKFSFKRLPVIMFVMICVLYYQLKEYQVRNGILDEYLTYKEIFWRNFFRTGKSLQYPVPPESIVKSEKFEEGFESPFAGNLSQEVAHSGKQSLVLDPD